MAVNTNDIKIKLLAMFEDMATTTLNAEEAREFIAEEWATIIKDAITSADVTGVTTITTGTSPSGPTFGTGTQNNTGSLS